MRALTAQPALFTLHDSVTIDTMFKASHGWWKRQCAKYNTTLPITVLCVPSLVETSTSWGKWSHWQEYVSEGFEVASHTMTHGSGFKKDASGSWVPPAGWLGTEWMDPEHYQYPLTLKVRIDNAWKQVSASQNNAGLPATVITHEGNNYALVDVVPNRGPFTLSP